MNGVDAGDLEGLDIMGVVSVVGVYLFQIVLHVAEVDSGWDTFQED